MDFSERSWISVFTTPELEYCASLGYEVKLLSRVTAVKFVPISYD